MAAKKYILSSGGIALVQDLNPLALSGKFKLPPEIHDVGRVRKFKPGPKEPIPVDQADHLDEFKLAVAKLSKAVDTLIELKSKLLSGEPMTQQSIAAYKQLLDKKIKEINSFPLNTGFIFVGWWRRKK